MDTAIISTCCVPSPSVMYTNNRSLFAFSDYEFIKICMISIPEQISPQNIMSQEMIGSMSFFGIYNYRCTNKNLDIFTCTTQLKYSDVNKRYYDDKK